MHAISRRSVVQGLCGCTGLALAGCVSNPETTTPIASNYVPASNSLEGGLWQILEDVEGRLRHSPLRVVEPGLNRYLTELACELAGDHCPNLRIYVLETPQFNASMAANGMMQIWSGLLLRCRNEAELASVIGHEIGHYVLRHSLQQLQNTSNQAAFAAFTGAILTGLTGANHFEWTRVMALANIFAFSREQEFEADEFGFNAMTRAGYAPLAASDIWRGVLAEANAGLTEEEQEDLADKRDLWTATHPTPNARITRLTTAAATYSGSAARYGKEDYARILAPFRDDMMEAELRQQRFDRTLVLINRLEESTPRDANVLYYRGEVHRRRANGGDELRALQAYGEALEREPGHARAWRGIGIVHRRAGRPDKAAEAFRRYLKFAPGAEDRLMIQSFLGAQS